MDIFGWKRVKELESALEEEKRLRELESRKRNEDTVRWADDLMAAEREIKSWAKSCRELTEKDLLREKLANREQLAYKFSIEPMSRMTPECIARAFAMADAWIAAREGKA